MANSVYEISEIPVFLLLSTDDQVPENLDRNNFMKLRKCSANHEMRYIITQIRVVKECLDTLYL